MKPFQTNRQDGRSCSQVLLEYVKDAEPGREYTFDELSKALSDGAGRDYDVTTVRTVVANSYSRLLREQCRTLRNIRGKGYKLAHAGEHCEIATVRKHRADRQLKRGLQALKDVRWVELDPNARRAHEAMLLVVSGIYENQRAMERRLSSVEEVIRKDRVRPSNGGPIALSEAG